MRFWKDNRIDGEHEVSPVQAAEEFWKSDEAAEWIANGGRFERTLVAWLSTTYGSWDPEAPDEGADFQYLYDTVWVARPR